MSDLKNRIAIMGAAGRMGRQLIKATNQIKKAHLAAVIVRTTSSFLGIDAGELAGCGILGIQATDNLNDVVNQFDVLIDFSTPETTLNNLEFCLQYKKGMIIGTTGFDKIGKNKINLASKEIGIVLSSNFSVGVNLVLQLLEKTVKIIGDSADIEIMEAHHRDKVDAPSGTALAMGEAISNVMNWNLDKHAVYSRQGNIGERIPQTIGFTSIRAGDIVGEHTAIFADIGERIEITHKASSRIIFANGAVRAALWLKSDKGLYNMRDVLNLD